MLSLRIKDLKKRKAFYLLEKSSIVDRVLFINILNKNINSLQAINFFSKKKFRIHNDSKTRITRRCVFTNRNRSALRPFGISRVYLRELMQFGIIPGYSKAVW